MKIVWYTIALVAIVITITPIVLYLRTYLKASRKLHQFRMDIQSGQKVIVSDGNSTFQGMVVGKTKDFVRVTGPSGNYAAYGYKCIYPIIKKEEIL